MTAPPSTPAAPPSDDVTSEASVGPSGAGAHAETPARLTWLEGELAAWRAEGLVDDATVTAIRQRYVVHRRVTLSRIVLTLGAGFVGLGLLWLVGSNLDEMTPAGRLAVLLVLAVVFVVGAELLRRRRASAGDVASPVVGAVRLLAAGSFGAVVLQAADSLDVDLDTPWLLGVWAVLVLGYAYLTRAVGPVVLGAVLAAWWFVWQVSDTTNEDTMLLAAAAAALALVAVGVLHGGADPALRRLGVPWREVGAVVALGALFVAALPFHDARVEGPAVLVVGAVLAVLLAGAAAARGDTTDRLEVALAAAAAVLVGVLAWWSVDGDLFFSTSRLTPGEWARSVVAVAVFLGVAGGYAALGAARDSDRVTWLATAALVVFTTTQAFVVFTPVLSGAWLFLAMGVVLLGTGWLADRARRRLVARAGG